MNRASTNVRSQGGPAGEPRQSRYRNQQHEVLWLVALPAFAGLVALGYSLIGIVFSPLM